MSRVTNLASERGAVLIQTAIAATVLVGFGAFVADYGVLWIARHQAQNAADAGAMAGAVARAYDDFFDNSNPADSNGVAAQNALVVAGANPVWGTPATAFLPPMETACPPEVGAGRCVRVDVHRDGDNGSTALPTFFGPMLGVRTQGIRATATARVLIPNATNCLRPWAIPDRWTEGAPGPEFTKYGAGGALLTPHDDYTPPDTTGPGPSSYQFATSNGARGDLGLWTLFSFADITDPANPIRRESIVALNPPGGYAGSIDSCSGQPVSVGDTIPVLGAPGAGDLIGLFVQDLPAQWNQVTATIADSCAPGCAVVSPRLVPIATFDVDLFQYRREMNDWTACPPGTAICTPCPGGAGAPCVSVVNIVGLFIGEVGGIGGYLTSYPGLIPTGAPKLTAASSFLKAITLVR